MTGESRAESSRINTVKGWLAIADVVLAAGSALAAGAWFWFAEGQGIAVITTLLALLTAVAFVLAHVALKRNWRRQWALQLAGPAMVIFLLFGFLPAAVATALLALTGWFAVRKLEQGDQVA